MSNRVYKHFDDFVAENREHDTHICFDDDVAALREDCVIGSKRFSNRLACQAMEGCDGTRTSEPDVLTKRRYARLTKGGAGVIWYEATAVLPEGRANPRQLYINEANVDAFARHVEEIKELALRENGYEPRIFMQATHSGRYSKPNGVPEPLIAYNNPIFERETPISSSRIVTDEYLDRVGEKLVNGARLAEKAGFDGVDIKCCHCYLNSELLSAYERTGKYGGSFENRTRLLREAVQGAIQSTDRDFLVSSRLNVYDGFVYPYGFGVREGGGLAFDPTEPIQLIRMLYDYGVRILNITMGNPYFNPHVNRPYTHGGYEAPEHPLVGVARMLNGTAQLKEAVPGMKLICSALSYLGVAAPRVAAAYIQQGKFDFAGFGRTILAYPDFAKDILQNGAMAAAKCCICCSKCTEIMRQRGGTPGCVVRDGAVYAPIYKEFCGGDRK